MAFHNEHTDLQLLEQMAQGNKAAFTEIYNRYWKKMLMIAWNHAKDTAIAEDIVHEVFLLLWEKRKEDYIRNVPAYLATAIKFSIFKHYQREHRRADLAKMHFAQNQIADDEEKLDALFLKQYIDGLVDQLPEKCRLTFKYSRIDGLSNAEIAATMEISEKGVEANLTRALKIIRSNLRVVGPLIFLSPTIWKDFF